MILWLLFLLFLQIGALSFGGGLAVITWIQSYIVEQQGWLSLREFADLLTLSQMTPGPIGINAATFVGVKTYGILGALVATPASVLVPISCVSILALLYRKYQELPLLQNLLRALRPAALALLTQAAINVLLIVFFGQTQWVSLAFLLQINLRSLFFFLLSLLLKKFGKLSTIPLMFLIGFIYTLFKYLYLYFFL